MCRKLFLGDGFKYSAIQRTAMSKDASAGSADAVPVHHFLTLGGGASIQSLIYALEQEAIRGAPCRTQAKLMLAHLKRIAGHQVRNVGTIAGSVALSLVSHL